jgi:SAM-dependent methyltransferase
MPTPRLASHLTTSSFWEESYLPEYEVPSRPRSTVPFERCLVRALDELAPAAGDERVLELGCAPGRWLVHYAERYGALVEGVELAARGVEQTKRNFAACGVAGKVHAIDLLEFRPDHCFDLVLSLGVIEHFGDVDATFRRHADLVVPGGRLLIGVPNFQGINRALQRWCDDRWLALHNMRAMGTRGYARLARANGLAIAGMRYVGGFDPDLISQRKRRFKLLGPFWRSRYKEHGDRLNAWWCSSYLLAAFTKPTQSLT